MKKVLLIPTLSLLLNPAFGDSGNAKERRRFNVIADFTYNSNSIVTKDTPLTDSASTTSTFIAIELGADYFVRPKFAITAQMLFALSASVDAEIKGFDVGGRYYLFKNGHQTEVQLLGSKIETTPGWASFIYAGIANRDYQFSNTSISFQGLELGGGIDYHFTHHYFFRGGLNYQMLRNTSTRTLTGFAGSVGLGYSF